jgi:hypothetical protein
MEQDQPSSPATGHRPRGTDVDDGVLPGAPPPSVIISALVVGGVVTLFSLIMSAAIFSWRVTYFPTDADVAGAVAFSVLPGLALLVFLRRWKQNLLQFNRDPTRWTFLVVPGFMVLGAYLGFVFIKAAYKNHTPYGVMRVLCTTRTATTQAERDACLAAGNACITRLDKHARFNELKDCVRKESFGAFPR